MSADSRLGDCRMRIWPSTDTEISLLGARPVEERLDQDGLLTLAAWLFVARQVAASPALAGRAARGPTGGAPPAVEADPESARLLADRVRKLMDRPEGWADPVAVADLG